MLTVLLAILMITIGGRTFSKIVLTDHFVNEHPECINLKKLALKPDSHWDWMDTIRGPCAFFKNPKTGNWIVLILAISGGIGAKAVLTLVTAFRPDEPTPQAYLKRKSYR
jgi:hypothetical protein